MKIEVQDISALPKWLQNHVSEGSLDLSAVPEPEDVTGLKEALQKERGFVREWNRFKDEFGTPDEARSKFKEIEKGAKQETDAEAKARMDALEAKYAQDLEARDRKIANLQSSTAKSNLKAELAAAGFVPEAIDDIANSAMTRFDYNEDGSVKIMTSDGKPMLGSGDGHTATMADLAKELAETKPYAVADTGKGGGAKPPGSKGGTPDSNNPLSAIKGFDALPES